MNYQRIYDQIIDRAKNRYLNGYYEKHHILPKCLGGSNEKENLVNLTAREHFLCHMLLCRIYPNNKQLSYALFLMSTNKNKKDYQKYKVSSKTYERIKEEHSKLLKQPRSKEIVDKITKTWNEKDWKSPKSRNKKIQEKLTNRDISSWKHKIYTEERNKKIGEKNKLNNNVSINQYDLKGNFIKNWSSISEASRFYSYISNENAVRSSISGCLRNKTKTALKFKWKYEK